MKKFVLLCILATGIVSIGCKSKAGNDQKGTDTTKFYPYTDAITAEINTLMKAPPVFTKTLTLANITKDSGVITPDAFLELTKPFLDKDITTDKLKQQYRESVFSDLTTNNNVLNYSTTNKELEIQAVDVILNSANNSLKRIDIRAFSMQGDSTVQQSLSWVAGKKFYISTYKEGKDGKGISQTQTVSWNNK